MRRRTVLPLALLSVVAWSSSRARGDWPQFRGLNNAGVIKFGPGSNELWSASIGSGHSSPVIVGDVIYLTAYDQAARELQ